jgi:putative hydroxymethylpyrimidine transport system substrate-binding protein
LIARRQVFGGLAATLGAQALASCGKTSERLTVVLDWLFNVNHTVLFAAQHTGGFTRNGLDVALISPADPDSPARLVAAGQADLAVSYGTQINMLTDKGLPLVRVATLIDRPMNSIMALGGGAIRTIADLKGRKVGISVGGVEEALLDAMLRSGGLSPKEVTVVRVNYQMVTALLSHQIDAATGAFRNAEVLEVQAMAGQPVVFAPEDHGVPLYDELILVTRRERRSDPRLAGCLKALRQGADALQSQPDALWRAFRTAHPELDNKIVAKAWPITLGCIARDPRRLDRQRYLQFQQFCLAQGIISKILPLDQFAVEIN